MSLGPVHDHASRRQDMRRVGIFGGTFDPIHHGHLSAADSVAHELSLDEVVLVPAPRPWQKTHRFLTGPEHRYRMTVLAASTNPRFRVSRVDIDRAGPTYTLDTVTDLRREYEVATEFFFIVGADTARNLGSWRAIDKISELATFVAVNRPGHDFSVSTTIGIELISVEVPDLEISSTALRQRVQNGEPIQYLVPDSVAEYISENQIYQS